MAGDGGYRSLALLWRVMLAGDAASDEGREKARVPVEEAVRAAQVVGRLTRRQQRQLEARVTGLRLQWDAADALAEWLRITPWEWYGTLTFLDCRDAAYAARRFGQWLDRVNRRVWGRRYRKRPSDGLWGFVAWERQRRGDWHAHLVAAGAQGSDVFAAMKDWEAVTRTQANADGSYARIYVYDPERGGAGYCAKYVTKEAAGDGAWDIFGTWPPQRWPLLAAQA